MKSIIATAVTLAALAALPLIAQTPPPPPPHSPMHGERFKAADTNKDGMVSRAEWDAAQRANDPFTRIDANKDGQLTEAEMLAFRETMRAERGGKGRSDKGRGGQGGGGMGDPAAFFAGADSNKDGSLTSAEWQGAGRRAEGFARVDASADGKVSKAEFDAMVAQMQARRGSN